MRSNLCDQLKTKPIGTKTVPVAKSVLGSLPLHLNNNNVPLPYGGLDYDIESSPNGQEVRNGHQGALTTNNELCPLRQCQSKVLWQPSALARTLVHRLTRARAQTRHKCFQEPQAFTLARKLTGHTGDQPLLYPLTCCL